MKTQTQNLTLEQLRALGQDLAESLEMVRQEYQERLSQSKENSQQPNSSSLTYMPICRSPISTSVESSWMQCA